MSVVDIVLISLMINKSIDVLNIDLHISTNSPKVIN